MHQVSLNEAATLIAACGQQVTFLLSGEPGIGKSAILPDVAARLRGFRAVYIDCTLLDVGDVQMPLLSEQGVRFVPNLQFVSHDKMPLVVMLDELGKSTRAVRNALLPLLYERRVGSHRLPEGSVVFATTNLATDGVGDVMEAHARNRLAQLEVRKPDAQEWLKWAQAHGVNSAVTGWVNEFPHCLQSYSAGGATDGVGDNPYIYNPKRPAPAFVTPRSLAAAGKVVDQADHFSPSALHAALAGLLGAPAAADMEAFVSLRSEIAGLWARILVDGTTAPVPANPLSHLLIVQQALLRLIKEPAPAIILQWMQYLNRLPKEVQALFVAQAGQHGALVSAFFHSGPEFRSWAIENRWMNT